MLSIDIALAMPSAEGPGFRLELAFDVPPGVTVLFGPSGAGKSRTLACIAGIARPDRGRISLGGDVWFDSRANRDLPVHRRRVAYVFQSLALFPHMTGEENVAYGADRATRQERLARAREVLARMHVGHLARRKPRTYSGGEAQRVALARALAMRPRVLLFDEPFSALDASVRDELLAEVRDVLAVEKVPTVLVTHRPEEARALGERVVFIENGKKHGEASIDAAFRDPLGESR